MQTIADQVSSVVDDRIAAFNETLDTESREMGKRLKKKLRSQNQVFQDKYHKEQYENNCDMLDKLEDLEKLRSAGNSRITKISSMVEAVEYRNKLIMIAENSAEKWVASNRHDQACKITDDSDDEKKIRQADAWAVRELEKQSRGRGRFQPYGRGHSS